MCVEFDLSDLIPLAVEFAQGATTIPYVDTRASRVVAQIISVIAVLQGFQWRIRAPIKDANGAIVSVCHNYSIGFRNVEHSLRFLEFSDGFHPFARVDIKDFQSVVAQRRNEEPMAFHINGKMVDSP